MVSMLSGNSTKVKPLQMDHGCSTRYIGCSSGSAKAPWAFYLLAFWHGLVLFPNRLTLSVIISSSTLWLRGGGVVWLMGFFECLVVWWFCVFLVVFFFSHTKILKKPNVMKLEWSIALSIFNSINKCNPNTNTFLSRPLYMLTLKTQVFVHCMLWLFCFYYFMWKIKFWKKVESLSNISLALTTAGGLKNSKLLTAFSSAEYSNILITHIYIIHIYII